MHTKEYAVDDAVDRMYKLRLHAVIVRHTNTHMQTQALAWTTHRLEAPSQYK